MKQTILIIFSFVLAMPLLAQQVNIVPQPTAVKLQRGTMALSAIKGYGLYGVTAAEIGAALDELEQELKSSECTFGKTKRANVKIGIPARNAGFRELCRRKGMPKHKIMIMGNKRDI